MEAKHNTPKYRRHRSAGLDRAFVELNGTRQYLGRWGSPESREKYDRVLAKWLANGRRLRRRGPNPTITELVAAFWHHAEKRYQSREALNFRPVIKLLRRLYGRTRIADFSAPDLKAVRGWILNLIEVSAFLHQFQREQRNGAIVASVDDYAVAYELAGEVLVDTFSDLRKSLRNVYERIRALFREEGGPVSRRYIRECLSMPDSTVRRWLTELVELEYLEVVEAGRRGAGKATRYRLAERGPKEELMLGLLSPEELRKNSQIAKKAPQAVAIFNS